VRDFFPASLFWLFTVIGMMGSFCPPAFSADGRISLVIDVVEVKEPEGTIEYALYDRAETFPKRQGRLRKGKVPATAPVTRIRIDGLTPGTFAVAIFHDANGNGEFDQGFLGIPLEDYGFSNDAMGFFSAPDFAEAKFVLTEETNNITVTLRR